MLGGRQLGRACGDFVGNIVAVRELVLSRPSLGDGVMTLFDYAAIGILIVLLAWVVAEHFPRGKL